VIHSLWTRFAVTAAAAAAAVTAMSAPAQATAPHPSAHLTSQMAAQLKRHPGGKIIAPDKIHYAKGDVTLTFSEPAKKPAMSAMSFMGCPDGNVCFWTQPNFQSGTLKLQTGSEWCPGDYPHGMGRALDLNDYGLYGNVRSVDSENSYTAVGWWVAFGWSNVQWTLHPHGDLASVSANHIDHVYICP